MKKYYKKWLLLGTSSVLSACSVISVVDTAVDVALLPVKAGVAIAGAVIPDGDD